MMSEFLPFFFFQSKTIDPILSAKTEHVRLLHLML